MQTQRKKPKTKVGIVVSDKMDKTAVVKLESFTVHKLYKKTIKRRRKVKAHDEKNVAKTGDKVQIMEIRPLSKEKRYKIVEIINKSSVANPQPTKHKTENQQPREK
jgi:small subunit ribosomal protein S17